ncbi:hypothetical protein, conserved [Trypanosoma brucei gambiense DAL972]|uniref:RanBP2-type domain-containing protein n=1 Tax=Trypanosoma brucei gambiense (strain MHOM/CI/86/DAL972) TaxID=679716 RepID=C9ZJJ2_TRYB9|nr:hypothetical protein, conserved [Trypanosoma brucei gambiense DAL972]CBH09551.1 hypothetical protein, conserved [Trypanosoma brucei gambiense DAL972]|eukprot:XP_011771856.1 hypothetical protein, conserved [Trypanosoma brucei gambiense DAL972]
MLKPPFIRQSAVAHARCVVPVEYGIAFNPEGSKPSLKSHLFSELFHVTKGRSDAALSVSFFLYNSLPLRSLIREGILCDIIVATGLGASAVAGLLDTPPPFPLVPGGEENTRHKATATSEEGGSWRLLCGVQREYALFVRDMVGRCRLGRGWHAERSEKKYEFFWTVQETWDCATTIFTYWLRQDNILSVHLLLPLACAAAAEDTTGGPLRKNMQLLVKRGAHGGVLWLLWRCAVSPDVENTELLESATVEVCRAPTGYLFQFSNDGSELDALDGCLFGENEREERLLLSLQNILQISCIPSEAERFSPFWRLLLFEMVRYAHFVLARTDVGTRTKVGALQSLRRTICSFRRHGRVLPILLLHSALVSASHASVRGDDVAGLESPLVSAAAGRFGPLVYREVLLLDAYTLMTVGHVGETAPDVNAYAKEKTSSLLSRCVAHLNALERSVPAVGCDRDAIGLHRGARAVVDRRLREAIRISFKLFLRCGAYEIIERHLHDCPSLGGSWEGGKALVLLGRYSEAVEVFTHFLLGARRHFAAGLPHYIRDLMLEAVEGASRRYCSESGFEEALVGMFRLYDLTRAWKFPIPPAVAFSAVAHGCAGANDSHLGYATPYECLQLLHALLHRHTSVETYRRDGLLSKVVELYVRLLGECRSGEATSDHFCLLSLLDRAHPGLGARRMALQHFLSLGFVEGISVVLLDVVGAPRCPVTHLSPLHEMPLASLESLNHHVTTTEMGEHTDKVLKAVQSALEFRRYVGRQRQPWRCRSCTRWNRRGASTCQYCGTLELAVIQCRGCGGFSPSNSPICLVCGAETLERGAGVGCDALPLDGCTIFPLRRWRCGRCSHTNEPQHLFYCARCASPQPTMEEAMARTAFDCRVCGRHNPLGMLRPWCSLCGTLCTAAASGPPKTLWRCVECHTACPWLLTHCHGCGATKSASFTRLDTPWATRQCTRCGATCPAWSVVCRSCEDVLEPTERDPGRRDIDFTEGGVEPAYTSCPHCGSLYGGKEAVACPTCHAPRPHTACTLWVCLKNNCLGVNLRKGSGEGLLACLHCGAAHDAVAVATYYTNPLRYREIRSCTDMHPSAAEQKVGGAAVGSDLHHTVKEVEDISGSGNHPAGDGDGVSPGGAEVCLPTALLFPLPLGPSPCASCGAFLHLENLAGVCPACNHCNQRRSLPSSVWPAEQEIVHRLRLKIVLNAVRRAAHGELSPSTALKLLRSAVAALQRAEEAALPWRGCDLSRGLRCGIRPRVPVLEDGTVHSAVRSVAEIIQLACLLALEGKPNNVVDGVPVVSWAHKRPWVAIALDLVDLMNLTTDYDELGFEVLSQLCELVRPMQKAHIYRETRWAYLRYMKLPRQWIVNDVVCPACLHRKAVPRESRVVTEVVGTNMNDICKCKRHTTANSAANSGGSKCTTAAGGLLPLHE